MIYDIDLHHNANGVYFLRWHDGERTRSEWPKTREEALKIIQDIVNQMLRLEVKS